MPNGEIGNTTKIQTTPKYVLQKFAGKRDKRLFPQKVNLNPKLLWWAETKAEMHHLSLSSGANLRLVCCTTKFGFPRKLVGWLSILSSQSFSFHNVCHTHTHTQTHACTHSSFTLSTSSMSTEPSRSSSRNSAMRCSFVSSDNFCMRFIANTRSLIVIKLCLLRTQTQIVRPTVVQDWYDGSFTQREGAGHFEAGRTNVLKTSGRHEHHCHPQWPHNRHQGGRENNIWRLYLSRFCSLFALDGFEKLLSFIFTLSVLYSDLFHLYVLLKQRQKEWYCFMLRNVPLNVSLKLCPQTFCEHTTSPARKRNRHSLHQREGTGIPPAHTNLHAHSIFIEFWGESMSKTKHFEPLCSTMGWSAGVFRCKSQFASMIAQKSKSDATTCNEAFSSCSFSMCSCR